MLLEPGTTIPDLPALDQDGGEKPLSERLGSNGAVIYFYPKDNTPGCTTESRDFEMLSPKFGEAGFAVIGISKDSVKSHVNFRAKQGLTFDLISDGDGALCEAFGVWQEKKNYGKTYMGIVRSTFVVDGAGLVRAVYPKVKVKGHAEQVLVEIQAG